MTGQSPPHNRYLIGRENKNGEKSLFYSKSISSFIFQEILLKFSGNVPYIIGKFQKLKKKNIYNK